MITGFFGLPGCGKTTFLTKFAQKELRRIRRGKSPYKRVLTNFYCHGCDRLDYSDLGKYDISDSLILLDEITLDADSRNFKQFDASKKLFFLMHRHFGCDIIYFTQQWDGVDKKIRDITVNLYFVRKLLCFSVAKRIYRQLDINDMTREIVQGYRFPNWFESVFTFPYHVCFRPLYYRYFDSFEVPQLPDYTYESWDKWEREDEEND